MAFVFASCMWLLVCDDKTVVFRFSLSQNVVYIQFNMIQNCRSDPISLKIHGLKPNDTWFVKLILKL